MSLEIMTPTSLRWHFFVDALSDLLTAGLPDDTWRCDGDGTGGSDPALVHRYAKEVMTSMGGIDVAASLEFFRDHGGYCDCEVLFNVDHVTAS